MAAADALVITPRGDYPTTSIAWAFAAGATVVGTAVYAVAELVSHKLNGLLFKRTPQRRMVRLIIGALRDRASHAKLIEVARGQAYEIFSVSRYVDQHLRLWDNVLSGAPPADGIIDSAMTG